MVKRAKTKKARATAKKASPGAGAPSVTPTYLPSGMLDEFVKSPFPGERLAAVTILQVFAAEEYLGYLVDLIGSEKPFIGYHAVTALRFAVGSLEPASYPPVAGSIE